MAGFENALVPEAKSLEFYGIAKDSTKVSDLMKSQDFIGDFLRKGFVFNMKKSLLGMCTDYHEKFCYDLVKKGKSGLGDRGAIRVGQLLGLLVDTAKNGYTFNKEDWQRFKIKNSLPHSLDPPAYKDPNGKASNHIIDQLVHVIAKGNSQETLSQFDKRIAKNPKRDEDLIRIIKYEEESSQNDSDHRFAISGGLKPQFQKLKEHWEVGISQYNKKRLSWAALVDQIREHFLQIQPWTRERSSDPPKNALVQRWIQEQNEPENPCSILGSWRYVKASTLYRFTYLGQLAFHACGRELVEIKVSMQGLSRMLTAEIHHYMKVDRKMLESSRKKKAGSLSSSDTRNFSAPDLDVDDITSQGYAEAWETMSMAE